MKINSHSVTETVDIRNSGFIVPQSLTDRLNHKERRHITYTLTITIDTLSQEGKTFKGINIDIGKSSLTLMAHVLAGMCYIVLLRVNWLVQINADLK